MVLSEISLSDTFNHAHGVSMHMGERCVTHGGQRNLCAF